MVAQVTGYSGSRENNIGCWLPPSWQVYFLFFSCARPNHAAEPGSYVCSFGQGRFLSLGCKEFTMSINLPAAA